MNILICRLGDTSGERACAPPSAPQAAGRAAMPAVKSRMSATSSGSSEAAAEPLHSLSRAAAAVVPSHWDSEPALWVTAAEAMAYVLVKAGGSCASAPASTSLRKRGRWRTSRWTARGSTRSAAALVQRQGRPPSSLLPGPPLTEKHTRTSSGSRAASANLRAFCSRSTHVQACRCVLHKMSCRKRYKQNAQ